MDMSDAIQFVESLIADEKPVSAEEPLRRRLIAKLFSRYPGPSDAPHPDVYLEETYAIPVDKLAISIITIIRSRVYPSVPTIGDLWQTARNLAGMNRDQYEAGRYFKPPRDWPPPGLMHAIQRYQFEPLLMPEQARNLLPRSRVLEIGDGDDVA